MPFRPVLACRLAGLILLCASAACGTSGGSDAGTSDAGTSDAGTSDAGDAGLPDSGVPGDAGVPRAESLATAFAERAGATLDIDEMFWNPGAFPEQYPVGGMGSFERFFVPPCQDGSTPSDRVCPDGEPVRCTDGTRPVIYYRAGTSNRWIFRVQNGGVSCEVDYLEDGSLLRARNCWHRYNDPEDRGAFTSAGTRSRGSLDGIYRDDASNPFRDYNVVYLDKCVGDRNLGDATVEDYRYIDRTDPAAPVVDYVGPVYFHGFRIIEAALRGIAALPGVRPIDAIAFQTHSNGSNGQYMYIDRLADIVHTIQPSAEVRGIATSMIRSSLEIEATADAMGVTSSDAVYDTLGGHYGIARHISAAAASPANGQWISSYVYREGGVEWMRATGWGALDATPTVDQSCLDAHPGEPGTCLDHMHVLLNHISTPLFLVAQQRDPVLNSSQHSYTTAFDTTVDCDPGAACCHDENYTAGQSCTSVAGSPFLPMKLAVFSPDDLADRVLSLVRGLVEGFATRSEMRPGCTGSPCDPSTLPSPMHGGFIDDVEDHLSVQDDSRATGRIGGRTLASYLHDWLEMGTPTMCVDVSGDGLTTSGTPAPWAPCPVP